MVFVSLDDRSPLVRISVRKTCLLGVRAGFQIVESVLAKFRQIKYYGRTNQGGGCGSEDEFAGSRGLSRENC